MKTAFALLFLFSLLGGMTGCASSQGFNRGALRESLETKPVITDSQIAQTLALKPQLPKPFKVAVLFREPVRGYEARTWRWTDADKATLAKLADGLKASGEVSDVFVMSHDMLTTPAHEATMKEMRLAAARHGADALLIISGAQQIDSYSNNWGWTYLAIAPMFFVQGTQQDALFLARASLWDVRNEFLYMSAESEAIEKQTAPLAFTDEKVLVSKAKDQAVALLSTEVANQIKGLKPQAHAEPAAGKRSKIK